ncbi:unnamed protein product [Discula destructiva]
MKGNDQVISEFNEYVNMTASELEKWLKSDDSNSAGWAKDGGEGESVGHNSGRKIVEILKSNPDKNPDGYTEDQLAHMRKVASYCKRHLAQESAGNQSKDAEDVKKTQSYISLKNWGHDFLKAQGKDSGSANGSNGSKSASKQKEEKDDEAEAEADEGADDDGEETKDDEQEEKTGNKRKKSGQQGGSNKKQETRKTRSSKKNDSEDDDQDENGEKDQDDRDEEMEEEGEEEQEKEQEEEKEEENGDNEDKPSKKGPKKGDTVSWSWGSGNPKGKVLDVKEDKTTITTKNGNEVSRDGKPEDPAVVLDAGKSKAIKSAHELN